jgi:tetratricopeptide (TPR) repeat protein
MLFQIQKELVQNKKFKFSKLVESDPKKYIQLKQEYAKLSDNDKQKISEILQVFLLLLASKKKDFLFIEFLRLTYHYEKSEKIAVKKALGYFYGECDSFIKSVEYLLPLFDAKQLTEHNDLVMLVKALAKLGMHNNVRRVLEFALEKFPDNLSWKMEALNYQILIASLKEDAKDFQTIANNLNYLYKRCQQSEHYSMVATSFYQIGKYDEFIKIFDLAFQTFLPEDQKKEEGAKIPFNSALCRETMDELIDILEGDGIRPFPIAGSLLGLFRDGKFMEHDKDADIGIFINNYEEIFEMVSKICKVPKFTAPDMVNRPKESRCWNVAIYDDSRNMVVDLFFFHSESTYSKFGVYTSIGIVKWAFTPFELERKILAGKEYWLPENIEQHLVEMYGENWREPIEVWDSLLNCPNLTLDSQPAAIYFGLMRLWDSLKKRKTKKALNYYETLTTKWGMFFSVEAKENIERLLELNEN